MSKPPIALRAFLASFGMDADELWPALAQLKTLNIQAEVAKAQAAIGAIPTAIKAVAAKLATIEQQNARILALLGEADNGTGRRELGSSSCDGGNPVSGNPERDAA